MDYTCNNDRIVRMIDIMDTEKYFILPADFCEKVYQLIH